MTASAPPLAFMIVDSGPVGSTNLKPSAQVGAGVPRKGAAGHQPQSFGGHPNGARAQQKSRVVGRLKLLRNLDDSLETPRCCSLSKWPPTFVPPVAEVGSGGRRVDPSRRPLLTSEGCQRGT